MGFFRRLFGAKKAASSPRPKEKRRWSFARSSNSVQSPSNKLDSYDDNLDANKHAIAVAAATAAVAEAALAAAQAAAEVVRLTTAAGVGGGGGRNTASGPANVGHRRLAEAAVVVKIQSAFRGYLARRALRALKALVKLQALVRGHIVRKQTADMLRRMQTLVRLQARARATRTHIPELRHSTSKSSHTRHAVPAGPHMDRLYPDYSTKFDGPSTLKRCGSNSNLREGSNWLDHWMEESFWSKQGSITMRSRHADDEKSDKILEVDTWKPHVKSQQSIRAFQSSQYGSASDNNNQSFATFDFPSKGASQMPNFSSAEFSSLNSHKSPLGKDEAAFMTAENSPHMFFSPSSRPGSSGRRGPFTPTKSECAWGFFNGYAGYPNYMANTESFQAKVRSQSAPRQRLEFEKYNPSKRSLQGSFDADTISERGFAQHTNFRNRAYPASSDRLNRVGSTNLR